MFAKFLAPLALASMALAAPTPAPANGTASIEKRDFYGTATYYDTTPNAGNCGWWNSPDEWVVALNRDQYFDNGNNGHCGWDIWICNDESGACADAKVVDQCPSCSYGSLDLSEGLFGHLTNGNYGQGVFNLRWGWH